MASVMEVSSTDMSWPPVLKIEDVGTAEAAAAKKIELMDEETLLGHSECDGSALVEPRRSRSPSAEDEFPLYGAEAHRVRDAIDYAAINRMREWLRLQGFGMESEPHMLKDVYIHETMTVIKDGKQRTFDYCAGKLRDSLQWRRDYAAATITAADVARPLAPDHMFWSSSCDKFGRPILFVRPALMDLTTYCRAEYIRAHIYLIEEGLRRMGDGISSFVLVADATGLGMRHLDMGLMRSLLQMATVGYPDRLGQLIAGPANWILRAAWVGLRRLMSPRMASKICITRSPRKRLQELLPPPPPATPPSAPVDAGDGGGGQSRRHSADGGEGCEEAEDDRIPSWLP